MQLYHNTTIKISQLITESYSTSFSLATSLIERERRDAIYCIYGFVRFADEIVDSFHDFDKKYLLDKFESDYYEAIEHGISLNPILNSFMLAVKKYNISDSHIQSFLKSMKFDLDKKDYATQSEIDEYIYGSADVVGLMCLKVFCNGNEKLYIELEAPAMNLGSAFQKVNFLRDLKNDIEGLDRRYFPEIDKARFNEKVKLSVVKNVEADFDKAYDGIKRLPKESKLAVLVAYYYYKCLLEKIKWTSASKLLETRIRVSNPRKMYLMLKAMVVFRLRLV